MQWAPICMNGCPLALKTCAGKPEACLTLSLCVHCQLVKRRGLFKRGQGVEQGHVH